MTTPFKRKLSIGTPFTRMNMGLCQGRNYLSQKPNPKLPSGHHMIRLLSSQQ